MYSRPCILFSVILLINIFNAFIQIKIYMIIILNYDTHIYI